MGRNKEEGRESSGKEIEAAQNETWLTSWSVVGIAAFCGGVWATYVSCPDCIDRNRVNKSCVWGA